MRGWGCRLDVVADLPGRIAEWRKRTAEVDGKLRRLYDAIENGVADLSDPMVKDRIVELKAIRSGSR